MRMKLAYCTQFIQRKNKNKNEKKGAIKKEEKEKEEKKIRELTGRR